MSSIISRFLIASVAALTCLPSFADKPQAKTGPTYRTPRSIDELLGDSAEKPVEAVASRKPLKVIEMRSPGTPIRNAKPLKIRSVPVHGAPTHDAPTVTQQSVPLRSQTTMVQRAVPSPRGARKPLRIVEMQAYQIVQGDETDENAPPRVAEADGEAVVDENGELDIDARERLLDELEQSMDDAEDEDPFADDSDSGMPDEEASDESDEDDTEEDEDDEEEDDDSETKAVDPWVFASLPSIRSVTVNPSVSPGIMPENYAQNVFANRPSEFHISGFQRLDNVPTHTHWNAPWVAYRPLYFEDPWLERHGYHYGHLQPLVSAAKFYGRIPFLPYLKGAYPCDECRFSYGMGRPGDCPPHFFSLPRRSRRGIWYETAAILAFAL